MPADSLEGAVSRLLQPASDGGVALQAVLVLVATTLAWRLLRARPAWRPLVIGCGLLLLGAMGLRAAH